MEPVPQIPDLCAPECPDTAHIIREEFSDFEGQNTFPRKTAKNLQIFETNIGELKNCGCEVVTNLTEIETTTSKISNAEKALMKTQAVYLIKRNEEKQDLFKCKEIYPNVERQVLYNYCLVQVKEIFPHITERILDQKMMPYDFIFPYPCKLTLKEYNFFAKLPCAKNILSKLTGQQIYKLNKMMKANLVSHNIVDITETIVKKKNKAIMDNVEKGTRIKEIVVFSAEPKVVQFHNCEPNVRYEKILTLVNVSGISQVIHPPILPHPSRFSVRHNGNKSAKIAPGMSADFTVCYESCNFSDCSEKITFNMKNSKSFQVEVKSTRDKPILRGLVYTESQYSNNEIQAQKYKDEVRNFTIDCGPTLLGFGSEIKFLLENIGGPGRFFLLSEEDWLSREVSTVTDDLKLILGDFAISPAFFELIKDEIIELNIDFTPLEDGFCCNKFYIVCDSSCSVQEVDIIGDAICYENDYFQFKMPECPFLSFKHDHEIKNILHLGAVYKNHTVKGSFTVCNHSTIYFRFEWRKFALDNCSKYKSINENWIEIKPSTEIIAPMSEMKFEVSLRMPDAPFGLYKFIYKLYLIDLPEDSLYEGPVYNFGEEYKSKDFLLKLLSVEVDKFEVQVHHIEVPVRIYPEEISLKNLEYNIKSYVSEVKILNEGFCRLNFKWEVKDQKNPDVQFIFEPEMFKIDAQKIATCKIFIKPESYDDIKEVFALTINENLYEKYLPFEAKVKKPEMFLSKSFFNLGLVSKDSYKNCRFYVQNLSKALLCWEIVEYQYNFVTHEFQEAENINVSCNCGLLCHQCSYCNVDYVLDTSAPKKLLSLLVLFSIYKDIKYESGHIIILADIQKPEVVLLSDFGDEQIFRIEDEYYEDEIIKKTFQMHNNSMVSSEYNWGDASGQHIDYIAISFDANSGEAFPHSRKTIEITMKFKKCGLVYDYYIPCWVKSLDEPIILHICCKIKKKQIIFSIPIDDDFIDIAWPFDFPDMEHLSAEDAGSLKSLKKLDEPVTSEDEKSKSTDSSIFSLVRKYNQSKINKLTITDDNTEAVHSEGLYRYLKNLQGEEECSTPERTDAFIELSNSDASTVPIHARFGSKANICEYVIELMNMKCRKVYKKIIKITNDMNYSLNFRAVLKHFNPSDFNRKKLDHILMELKWIPDTTYSDQLSPYGIVVFIKPICCQLVDRSVTSIELAIYAETFGYYLEEITFTIDQIPDFRCNLIMEVIGCPIQYPILPTSEYQCSDLLIKFDSMTKCAFKRTRTIHLYNHSTIPCNISWHLFTKNMTDPLKSPINVMFDIFAFDNANEKPIECKMKLHKYMGKKANTDFELFTVQPSEININPKETKQIIITFNPRLSETYQKIEATLIGNIHIPKEYRYVQNFIRRDPDKDVKTAKILLEANIEMPLFDFKYARGDTELVMHVNEIIKNDSHKKIMRIVFRNTSTSNVFMTMRIKLPFTIVCIRSAATDSDNNVGHTPVFVYADSCVEVLVGCDIPNGLLMNIADILYKKVKINNLKDTIFLSDYEVVIKKNLQLLQECNIFQNFPLKVKLLFPLLEVSTSLLNFGNVTLKTKKSLTFKLLNKSATETWIQIVIGKENNDVFSVDHKNSYLEAHLIQDKSVLITVSFSPKLIRNYKENLFIFTKLPQYKKKIILKGTGTYDEKYTKEQRIYRSKPLVQFK